VTPSTSAKAHEVGDRCPLLLALTSTLASLEMPCEGHRESQEDRKVKSSNLVLWKHIKNIGRKYIMEGGVEAWVSLQHCQCLQYTSSDGRVNDQVIAF
jgi:hypothetical protein